jgi:hypothetical protein
MFCCLAKEALQRLMILLVFEAFEDVPFSI